jgi:N-acetyl-beta-hexosaminidase
MTKTFQTTLFVLLISVSTFAADQLRLIPYPRQVERHAGAFTVSKATTIVLDPRHAKADRLAAEMLVSEIQSAAGIKPRILIAASAPSGAIRLTRLNDPALKDASFPTDTDEAYLLRADSRGIVVAGKADSGTFYGVQTLRQLLLPVGKKAEVPAVTIKDWPTMQWRGVHYDVSRGPIPTFDYMKQVIRTLSEYKINLFSLYMEYPFDFPQQSIIAPKEASITPAMIKDLIA